MVDRWVLPSQRSGFWERRAEYWLNGSPIVEESFTVVLVPEPAGIVLAAVGLIGLVAWRWPRSANPSPLSPASSRNSRGSKIQDPLRLVRRLRALLGVTGLRFDRRQFSPRDNDRGGVEPA